MSGVAATLGPAFAGYTIGAVLFGVTLLQAYHYFLTSGGSRSQKITVMIILLLDTIHFAFAIHMFFSYLLLQPRECLGTPDYHWVVWSLKAMGDVQVIFIIYVQALYLYKIWIYSRNVLLTPRFRRFLKGWVVLLSILAIGVGILFLYELQKIKVIQKFETEFEYAIIIGFGTVCFIDLGIAVAMCLMLYYTSSGIGKRSNMIVTQLIQYIVGTGLLTSLSALMCMVLYIANPTSLLYLGVEYSNTRLYAISVLALYNSQSRLRDSWNEPRDLKGSSLIHFADPGKYLHTQEESALETRSLDLPGPHGNRRMSRRLTADTNQRTRSRRGHRRRTSSMPDVDLNLLPESDRPASPESPGGSDLGRRYIFHDAEETLVQESPTLGANQTQRQAQPRSRTV